MTRVDPFADFINQQLYLGDDTFVPIDPPAPTDRRWHYGQYQAAATVPIYSQPHKLYDYGYTLRPTKGYAYAMLRYLPEIRPGWTAIQLTMGTPLLGYVRSSEVRFRPSSGVFEYLLMLRNSALIVVGLSTLIFLYAIPQTKPQHPNQPVRSTSLEQRVERFVARLENDLFPLE